jgi:peptidoglycan hydrolase-like protein with peptidoglycan-binding domain
MYEGSVERRTATEYRRPRSTSWIDSRPDRVALWAFAVGVVALVAGAASAQGSGGGTGAGGGGDGGGSGGCPNAQFGERTLSRGDCGSDVKTLNWILKAKKYAAPLDGDFEDPTEGSVEDFERKKDLAVNGIVEGATRRKLVRSMGRNQASWYGPGFFGNRTACGQRLTRRTVGVAHRSLPCGTKVVIGYKGRYLRTRVIDRGPYAKRYSNTWDLTQKAARKLDFTYTDDVRAASIN